MRKSFFISLLFFLLVPLVGVSSFDQPSQPGTAAKSSSATLQVLTQRNLPLEFIPNAGQLDGRVNFVISGGDRTLYFTPEGMTLALYKETKSVKPRRENAPAWPKEDKSGPTERWVVKMDFLGARKDVIPEGLEKTGAVFSYFKGNRKDWHAGLPGYRQIIYRDLWLGVDMVFKGDVGKLKYEYIVKPGADPSLIQLGIRGAKRVAVDRDGRLVVDTPLEKIIDEKPLVYQDDGTGGRKQVRAAYQLEKAKPGSARVGFSLADYDRNLPLIIDPATIVYCGYIDCASGSYRQIAVDGSGCAYVTGTTSFTEATFPVAVGPDLTFNGGWDDAFVAKVKADGTGLEYCGYIGGTSIEIGYGIAVDGSGCAYVTGYTSSREAPFPVMIGPDLTFNGGQFDAFVAKVNATGENLVYCGYIGGRIDDLGYGIAVDGLGCAYVVGFTNSTEATFPVAVGPDLTYNGGDGDVFVAKVKADGTGLEYCGYIGGMDYEESYGIALDGSGCAYVSGYTYSAETGGFPVAVGPDLTLNGYSDAFVARVRADGTGLEYCGYIGGTGYDFGYGIALDGAGCAYVTGATDSKELSFPVMIGPDLTFNGGWTDAFVAKVSANGENLVYCGYIGGTDYYDFGNGIAVDGAGCAYVTGYTQSTEATFPVMIGPDLTYNGGSTDAFVAKVSANGENLVYCGYIGGTDYDGGYGIAVDSSGCAYVAGDTRSTEATFPVVVGPDLTFYGGENDYAFFVAKIAYAPPEMFADIALSKSVDNIQPYVDDIVVFTIAAANLGPDNATGVAVQDLLPAGLSLVSASATQGTYDQATGLWTVGGLNDGGSATLTLRAKVYKEGTITNTATTAGLNETDPNELNNMASVSLTSEYRVYAPSNFRLQRLESDLIFSKEFINRLTWSANPLNKSLIVSCRLYRKANGQPDTAFALYREFGAGVTSFDDRGLKKDELFTYRLTSVNDKGKESEPVEAGN